jgi:predicted esterase YcpF (UPF0227 family)
VIGLAPDHSLTMLVYVHGFNSSPLSFKATLLRKRMAELGRAGEFVCPELPHRPAHAMALLERVVADHAAERPVLIGSSLGGYYSTWLAERHALRAVLVNPAVRPYDLLSSLLGRQTNLYSGIQYDFTEEHVAELRALEVERIHPERYLLLVGTADEVLDYRHAVERYRGCKQVTDEGGDHGLSNFERYVDRILEFSGIASAPRAGFAA